VDATYRTIIEAAEYAPAHGPTAPDLVGGWIAGYAGDWYICAPCIGRITARGCGHVLKTMERVWKSDPCILTGVCLCCHPVSEVAK